MFSSSNRKITKIVIILVIIVIVIFGFFIWHRSQTEPVVTSVTEVATSSVSVIGKSVEGRDITTYTFGTGNKNITFVGGIHGGYEWNSVYLAYKFIDYLTANSAFIPKNLNITVIPSANPDGLFKVIGKAGRFTVADVPDAVNTTGVGRFNARNVDLNRNFDCKWTATSTWKGNIVSAGTSAFSEPEAQAIKNFVLTKKPSAVIFWHSQASAVYASECEKGILTDTLGIMSAYAKAAGYDEVKSFTAYPVTGDAEGWLASINIPAITVELSTHDTIEWDKNLSGIKAVLGYYSQL